MNPLLKRLASLRRKVRVLEGWQGICALIALVLGVAFSVGVIDYYIHLPTMIRAAALVGLLVASGSIVYRYIVKPFGRPCDDLNLALRVEEEFPELNDCLASTVQFLKQSKEDLARLGGSEAMRERTVAETMEKASKVDFSRILDKKGAALFGVAAVSIALIAGAVVATQRDYAAIAFWRFVEPFGEHTWTRVAVQRLKNNKTETVDAYKQEKVAIKQAYHIKVHLSGQLPEKLSDAKIEIDGQIRTNSTEPIVREDGGAYFIKRFDMLAQKQKFKFRIVYNDGMFPPRANTWHEVEVLPEPRLVALDNQPSPQITLYPPRYTDLPSQVELPGGLKNMEMFAGTKVRFRAKADRPLKEAWIAYQTTNPAVTPAAIFAAGLGQTNPLMVAGSAAGQTVAWSRIPVALEKDDTSMMLAEFTPWIDGKYTLIMNDEYELEGREEGSIQVQRDPEPYVKVANPGASVTARPDGKIRFKFNVADEHFAVKGVFVEFRRKGADGLFIDDAPQRIPLYDAAAFGKLIPDTFNKLGYAAPPWRPFQGPLQRDERLKDLRLRYKKLDLETFWHLRNQFKEGETVLIEICSDDFCDVFSTREPGRSPAIELRIVGVRQLVQDADIKLNKIQNELKRIQKMEEQALATVKDTKTKDKVDAKDIENFIDKAEGPQRAIKDIVGNTPQEGLRKDLADVRQMLKDNNLEGTQAYRDAGKIKGTLDNIAQDELQQIEPRIADIRNELTQNNKNTPETKKKLEEVAKLEKQVLDSINELVQQLDPTAKMNDQKAQLREIIDREKQLLQELEELKADKQNLEKVEPERAKEIEKFYQEKINQKGMEQRELAQQMQKLIEQMKEELKEQEKAGNKENAQKLKDTIERLEKPKAERKPDENKLPVNAQMKRVAQELNNKSEASQKTLDQQKDIVSQLENALEAIEGRNEDMTKQEIQERQQAEKKIDDLNKQIQKLRDDFKKAELIEEMEERLKKKQELAAQHDKLIDQIEKTRRELARLQEQRAANDLNQAADKVDDARRKAQAGENPDQDLQKAQDDLKQARAELKESEEQLAREMLIKIADQLKGLKERQDAVLQRSMDLHPKIMSKKSWTLGLLDTIEGNIDVQKDIAGETDTLKDKLKEAKVFHSILERAKKSMDDAGTEMKNRHELGKQRRYLDEGKEIDERMDAQEIMEENEAHTATTKHQKQAAQRLDRILDALKEEIARKKPAKKNPDQVAKNDQEKDKEKEKEQGGMRPQDGIPPMAQLKALRAEQLDLNERTADFAQRNNDLKNLNDAQKRELRELEVEQERLQELFEQLLPPPPPAPNEGEKK